MTLFSFPSIFRRKPVVESGRSNAVQEGRPEPSGRDPGSPLGRAPAVPGRGDPQRSRLPRLANLEASFMPAKSPSKLGKITNLLKRLRKGKSQAEAPVVFRQSTAQRRAAVKAALSDNTPTDDYGTSYSIDERGCLSFKTKDMKSWRLAPGLGSGPGKNPHDRVEYKRLIQSGSGFMCALRTRTPADFSNAGPQDEIVRLDARPGTRGSGNATTLNVETVLQTNAASESLRDYACGADGSALYVLESDASLAVPSSKNTGPDDCPLQRLALKRDGVKIEVAAVGVTPDGGHRFVTDREGRLYALPDPLKLVMNLEPLNLREIPGLDSQANLRAIRFQTTPTSSFEDGASVAVLHLLVQDADTGELFSLSHDRRNFQRGWDLGWGPLMTPRAEAEMPMPVPVVPVPVPVPETAVLPASPAPVPVASPVRTSNMRAEVREESPGEIQEEALPDMRAASVPPTQSQIVPTPAAPVAFQQSTVQRQAAVKAALIDKTPTDAYGTSYSIGKDGGLRFKAEGKRLWKRALDWKWDEDRRSPFQYKKLILGDNGLMYALRSRTPEKPDATANRLNEVVRIDIDMSQPTSNRKKGPKLNFESISRTSIRLLDFACGKDGQELYVTEGDYGGRLAIPPCPAPVFPLNKLQNLQAERHQEIDQKGNVRRATPITQPQELLLKHGGVAIDVASVGVTPGGEHRFVIDRAGQLYELPNHLESEMDIEPLKLYHILDAPPQANLRAIGFQTTPNSSFEDGASVGLLHLLVQDAVTGKRFSLSHDTRDFQRGWDLGRGPLITPWVKAEVLEPTALTTEPEPVSSVSPTQISASPPVVSEIVPGAQIVPGPEIVPADFSHASSSESDSPRAAEIARFPRGEPIPEDEMIRRTQEFVAEVLEPFKGLVDIVESIRDSMRELVSVPFEETDDIVGISRAEVHTDPKFAPRERIFETTRFENKFSIRKMEYSEIGTFSERAPAQIVKREAQNGGQQELQAEVPRGFMSPIQETSERDDHPAGDPAPEPRRAAESSVLRPAPSTPESPGPSAAAPTPAGRRKTG